MVYLRQLEMHLSGKEHTKYFECTREDELRSDVGDLQRLHGEGVFGLSIER